MGVRGTGRRPTGLGKVGCRRAGRASELTPRPRGVGGGYFHLTDQSTCEMLCGHGDEMKAECDTKQRLLDTAIDLIWEQSYGAVSVDVICERAGARKGSFYHFFPSKSDLTVAAIEEHWEKLRPDLDRIFSPQTPPLERLSRYCDFIYERQSQKNAEIRQGLRLCVHFAGLRVEHAGREHSPEIAADFGSALPIFRRRVARRCSGRVDPRTGLRQQGPRIVWVRDGRVVGGQDREQPRNHPSFETDHFSIDWRGRKAVCGRDDSSRVSLTGRSKTSLTTHMRLNRIIVTQVRRTPCGLSD
jgi:AcrR family transcriptional regulator